MRLVFSLAGLLLLAACTIDSAPSAPATIAPPAASLAAAQPIAATADEKKICHSMPVMGSLTPKRVCSTKAEWDAFDKRAKDGSDKFDEQRKEGGQFRGETVQ
jgi:hypothetical protein